MPNLHKLRKIALLQKQYKCECNCLFDSVNNCHAEKHFLKP